MAKKPWGGRFGQPTDKLVEEFTESISFDRRLYRQDIEGSIAHCRVLAEAGIISPDEEGRIIEGLNSILADIEKGRFKFPAELEDIHMAVEQELTTRIGKAGERLHSGRSRNDQVALDLRLWLRNEAGEVTGLIGELKTALVEAADKEMGTVMPGYTHMQKAQPVLLSHYLLAFREMLDRDEDRFRDCLKRINVMPLGSAALAGTGLPLDRKVAARLLDFPAITANSMDAVSDRDFAAEFIFASSLLMMHMSRLCEDLVIWSSGEFGFVEIADSFTTGSSIMPQKKNPDVAELIRGKTGRVYGNLVSLLTVLKGLPMTYNRDLQEDKEPLFDTVDTVKACLAVLSRMLGNVRFAGARMLAEASRGFTTATDLAEYLVRKGVPFRQSHEIIGRLVGYCLAEKKELQSLSLEELKNFNPAFEKDALSVIDPVKSVDSRNVIGGTSRKQVSSAIRKIKGRSGK
ncbi:MAG: argininosuccinate lyase [Syntrophaceae bacterium]